MFASLKLLVATDLTQHEEEDTTWPLAGQALSSAINLYMSMTL